MGLSGFDSPECFVPGCDGQLAKYTVAVGLATGGCVDAVSGLAAGCIVGEQYWTAQSWVSPQQDWQLGQPRCVSQASTALPSGETHSYS